MWSCLDVGVWTRNCESLCLPLFASPPSCCSGLPAQVKLVLAARPVPLVAPRPLELAAQRAAEPQRSYPQPLQAQRGPPLRPANSRP